MSEREEYIDKMAAKLKELDGEIDKLNAKAKQAQANTKIEYENQVKELQSNAAEMRKKLDELKNAGEQSWEEVKTGVEASWTILSSSVKNAVENFK